MYTHVYVYIYIYRPFGHNENWKTRKKHWYHVDQANAMPCHTT